jgi:hypothetical protein
MKRSCRIFWRLILKKRPVLERAVAAVLLCMAFVAMLILFTRDFKTFPNTSSEPITGSERLYWEYAGRITGNNYDPRTPRWIHQLEEPAPGLAKDAQATQVLSPYTDFTCEYPPGALLYFSMLRILAPSFAQFAIAHQIIMALCLMGTFWFCVKARERLDCRKDTALVAGLFLGSIYLLGFVLLRRFDALTILLTSFAIFCITRERWRSAALALGIGGAVKLWPALIVPIIAIHLAKSGRCKTGLLVCVIGFSGFLLPHLLPLLHGTQVADAFGYLQFMSDRPIQIESTAAGIIAWTSVAMSTDVTTIFSFGSVNLAADGFDHFGLYLKLVLVAAYSMILLWVWRNTARQTDGDLPADRQSTATLLAGANAAIAITMLTSPVFSAEYYLWLIPFVLVLTTRREPLIGVLFFASLIVLRTLHSHWPALIAFETFPIVLLNVKNACIALLAIVPVVYCQRKSS